MQLETVGQIYSSSLRVHTVKELLVQVEELTRIEWTIYQQLKTGFILSNKKGNVSINIDRENLRSLYLVYRPIVLGVDIESSYITPHCIIPAEVNPPPLPLLEGIEVNCSPLFLLKLLDRDECIATLFSCSERTRLIASLVIPYVR